MYRTWGQLQDTVHFPPLPQQGFPRAAMRIADAAVLTNVLEAGLEFLLPAPPGTSIGSVLNPRPDTFEYATAPDALFDFPDDPAAAAALAAEPAPAYYRCVTELYGPDSAQIRKLAQTRNVSEALAAIIDDPLNEGSGIMITGHGAAYIE